MTQLYPILEYDPDPDAIIEPGRQVRPHPEMPEHGVMTFFQDVLDDLVSQGFATEIVSMRSEMGAHPIYVHEEAGRKVALFHPGVGAPLAAGLLEEVIALGCRKLVACGGAGVLDREIAVRACCRAHSRRARRGHVLSLSASQPRGRTVRGGGGCH